MPRVAVSITPIQSIPACNTAGRTTWQSSKPCLWDTSAPNTSTRSPTPVLPCLARSRRQRPSTAAVGRPCEGLCRVFPPFFVSSPLFFSLALPRLALFSFLPFALRFREDSLFPRCSPHHSRPSSILPPSSFVSILESGCPPACLPVCLRVYAPGAHSACVSKWRRYWRVTSFEDADAIGEANPVRPRRPGLAWPGRRTLNSSGVEAARANKREGFLSHPQMVKPRHGVGRQSQHPSMAQTAELPILAWARAWVTSRKKKKHSPTHHRHASPRAQNMTCVEVEAAGWVSQ